MPYGVWRGSPERLRSEWFGGLAALRRPPLPGGSALLPG